MLSSLPHNGPCDWDDPASLTVLHADGWPEPPDEADETIRSRLLALNLEWATNC